MKLLCLDDSHGIPIRTEFSVPLHQLLPCHAPYDGKIIKLSYAGHTIAVQDIWLVAVETETLEETFFIQKLVDEALANGPVLLCNCDLLLLAPKVPIPISGDVGRWITPGKSIYMWNLYDNQYGTMSMWHYLVSEQIKELTSSYFEIRGIFEEDGSFDRFQLEQVKNGKVEVLCRADDIYDMFDKTELMFRKA